jgi:hypothetical protein
MNPWGGAPVQDMDMKGGQEIKVKNQQGASNM